MSLPLVALLVFCFGSALAAVTRRNLIHAALLLIGNWVGIAAFYLWLGAEFVAFAQVLVYVGAVSMIVLFAVLLTRTPAELPEAPSAATLRGGLAGILTATMVGVLLCGAVGRTPLPTYAEAMPTLTVKQLGERLGEDYLLPLLLMGVLLTVALIGAVIIAAEEPRSREDQP